MLHEAFGGIPNVDLQEMIRIERQTNYLKSAIPLMWSRLRSIEFSRRLAVRGQILSTMLSAIRKISGCRVIIDSSKLPTYGMVLNGFSDVDLHIIHLVRDSRAVIHSIQNRVIQSETLGRSLNRQKYNSSVEGAIRWNIVNGLVEILTRNSHGSVFIRYEAFANNPQKSLKQVLEHIGESACQLPLFADNHTIILDSDHLAGGNRNRLQHGPVRIQIDNEWQNKMPFGQKFIVSMITLPFLIRYGHFFPSSV